MGTVLVMAAVAFVLTANAQLINAEIANIDCNQQQEQRQNSEQT
ncbi:hypothetical protein [Candidatus Nitrososphaera gargensis]|nr:hypothetical protein [Candidatus Nitrososphaera gargensis]